MRLFLGRLYLGYVLLWFVLTFLILLPLFLLSIFLNIRAGVVLANRLWCLSFFPLSFLFIKKIGKIPPLRGGAVIVSNHSSYLDIPVLTDVLNRDHAFLGKSSIAKVPLFGYMYSKLHILVDRSDRYSKKRSVQIAMRNLGLGRLVVIFPEGTIRHQIQPGLGEMKDGAFFLAVQAQVPIIPITLPINWKIFPDDDRFVGKCMRPIAIIHPPILTKGLTDADVPALKEQLRGIFVEDIAKYNR